VIIANLSFLGYFVLLNGKPSDDQYIIIPEEWPCMVMEIYF